VSVWPDPVPEIDLVNALIKAGGHCLQIAAVQSAIGVETLECYAAGLDLLDNRRSSPLTIQPGFMLNHISCCR
jgi:hypothetical protein